MMKRKSEEGKADGGDRKKVPLTATEDSASEASITPNASTSPLLSLPPEIRNKIWAAVLGDRLIHLQYFEDCFEGEIITCSVAHLVCENDGAENHSEENYLCNDVGSVRDGTQHSHHQCERELIRRFYHHETESYQTLHLKTLRVCRQVYHEANPILWSTNTFSFTDAISLKEFMQRTHQVSLLRKLRLQMNWTWGTTLWNSIPDVNLIRSLTGLTSLRLQINHSMEARLYSELSEQANQLGVFQSELPGFMHRMATLPLREVEVFVGDDSPVQLTKVLWTVENRKEYAEGIREMLLHPKGANASK